MEEITLGWFFEMPGILILGGVVLIILAIIIFILGGIKSKEKKEKNESMEKPIDVAIVKVNDDKKDIKIESAVIPVVESVVTPVVEPIVNSMPVVEPVVTPVVESVVEPAINKINLDSVQMIVPSNEEIEDLI